MRSGDFEVERGRRTALVDDLVTRGQLHPGALAAAARVG